MLKLSTLIALLICFVYCNKEHINDAQSSLHESQISKDEKEENKNTFQTIKGHYIEETQKSKPCKKNKDRRFNAPNDDNTDTDLFESLPITATLEETKTASTGKKLITSSVHGANYNIKNGNSNVKTDNIDLDTKHCDCDNCVLEANKKVLQFESVELGGNSNPVSSFANIEGRSDQSEIANSNNTPLNNKVTEESESDDIYNVSRYNVPLNLNTDSNNNLFNKDTADESTSDGIVNMFRDNDPLNFDTGEITDKAPCKKTPYLNTRRKKCGKANLSEISPTTNSNRRILPGFIENPTYQESGDNKLYQNVPKVNDNYEKESSHNLYNNSASLSTVKHPSNKHSEELYQDDPEASRQGEVGMESRHSYFPNVKKVSNSYGIDLVQNMNINEVPHESSLENSDENKLTEPTRGKGIYDMKEVGVMLLENSRVCYACSTISDGTCWAPNKRTTVKYCKKGHNSCLTKSFKHRGKSIIIRDCGSYCVDLPNGEESYSSCSICHSDLCNGAVSINIYSTGVAIILSFGMLFNMQYIKV